VPHAHFHILPRVSGDFEPVDAIYDHLDAFSATGAPHTKPPPLKMDDDARTSRSREEMAEEADHLATFFPSPP
jgi:bis(5'-adenosyl)-triphosphatase